MNCWFCSHKLIWQCDYDYEDFGIDEEEGIVSVLICPCCNAQWEGYYSLKNEEE